MEADTIESLKTTIQALEAQRDAHWAGYKPKQDKRTENGEKEKPERKQKPPKKFATEDF